MILSVSRRTDIPAFYSDWFFNRIKKGFVYVRNPMYAHNVSKVLLNPSLVDCIVFWTKNPKPMMSKLEQLKGYQYYFQFSLNAYGVEFEMHVPQRETLIDVFIELSGRIGKERVIWRYDPIFYTDSIQLDYHTQNFREIAQQLSGHTCRCVISFLDIYKKTERNLRNTSARALDEAEMIALVKAIAPIAENYHIELQTCSESIDLDAYGVKHGSCIDKQLIEEILGCKIEVSKDKNQRKDCNCIQSIDIGEYNTCGHGCLYCYANDKPEIATKTFATHNPNSPLISGEIDEADKLTLRAIEPLRRIMF